MLMMPVGVRIMTRRRQAPERAGTGGYTFVEVTVVLLLGATLSAMAVPGLSAIRAQFAVGTAAREIAVQLHRTRMRAVAENLICRLSFAQDGTYVRQCSSDGVNYVSEGEVVTMPSGISVLSTVSGLAAPTFNRLGTVAADQTITVSNTRGQRKVVQVNILGRITIS